jgi:DNA-directed RNA polymerase specialized sigma24 family protein
MALTQTRASLTERDVRDLTGRYNQRLFRIARAIVGQDAEAEDVVQEDVGSRARGIGSVPGRGRVQHLADAHPDQ